MKEFSKERIVEFLKVYLNFSLVDEMENANLLAYEEFTNDSKRLFIVTENNIHRNQNPNIYKDIFCYEWNVSEEIIKRMCKFKGHKVKLYIVDDYFSNDISFENKLEEYFWENIESIIPELKDKKYFISINEINWLKKQNKKKDEFSK